MSLLTNEGSMIALSTLRQINKDLSMVQQEISTGKSISNARDNAAIWAVSTVMQSDVDGFEAISSSLDLGASTVGVARGAAETITGLLQNMKDLIVGAQEENVDRAKIQTDIDQLESQITTIVDAAQFNGLNLLKGTDAVNILSSLNRAADGTVSTSNISIARNDLSISGGTAQPLTGSITASATVNAGSGGSPDTPGTSSVTIGGTIANTNTASITIDSVTYTVEAVTSGATGNQINIDAGSNANTLDLMAANLAAQIGTNVAGVTVTAGTATVNFSNASATGVAYTTAQTGAATVSGGATIAAQTPATPNTTPATADITIGGTVTAGEVFSLDVGSDTYTYTAAAGDDLTAIATGLTGVINAGTLPTDLTLTSSGATLTFSNLATSSVALANGAVTASTSSGLAAVSAINVTTTAGAVSALTSIETLINVGIDAAASFGSAQKRVDIQNEFLNTLTDSLKTGIGALVEADLEEASARLQSLQVQQQLGVQALSIANQRPQVLLGLFR